MSRVLNSSRSFFIVSSVLTEGSTFMNVNSFFIRERGNGSRARWKGCAFDVKEVEPK